MISGKTESGFKFQIDDQALNDMELIEELLKVDSGDITALPGVLKALLGEKQKKKLYDHVRTDAGRVPMDLLAKEVTDIFKASKTVKN